MRKILIVIILAFGLFGCDTLWFKDSTIYNESSYDVTFKAKKADQVTVQSGKSVTVQNDIGAVLEYYESNTPKRVDYIQTDVYKGKFVDLSSIPVKVYNTLSIPVTLSAGGYLGTDPMSDIQEGDNNANTIYTKSPVLTVTTSSFPATADFQIVDGVMFVTVR
jgi:hypothetical protein